MNLNSGYARPAAAALLPARRAARLDPMVALKRDWFLRDFGYDADLLGRDEIEERSLLGLTGVVRTSLRTLPGRAFLNLEAFAPAGE